MATRYRYVFKSDEDAGASQPNIIEVGDPLPDAAGFGTDLETLIAGDLTTITREVRRNYSRPYPAGTFKTAKVVMRDADGAVSTQWLYNVNDLNALVSGLEAHKADILLPNSGNAAVSVQVTQTNTQDITVT